MNKRAKALMALCAAAGLLLAGCAREGVDYATAEADIVDTFPLEARPAEANPQQAAESNTYAVFHTTAGDITVMLYPQEQPEETARFIEQVRAGKYDGQQFVYVRRDGLVESDNVEAESLPESSSPSTQADASVENSAPAHDGAAQPAAEGGNAAASQSTSENAAAQSGGAASSEAGSVPASRAENASAPGEASKDGQDGYTEEELAAVELPEPPADTEGPHYSDNLHHYYGALGISRENETGGDRLHFVAEQTKPEDERLVPAQLYMNELVGLRMAQLNAMTAEAPFTDKQLAAYEYRLNQEIAAIGTDGVPEEYGEKYLAAKETYETVGGQWALDYQYPIIGQVVEGQNIVDAISQAKVDAQTRRPKQYIVIEHVEIVEK